MKIILNLSDIQLILNGLSQTAIMALALITVSIAMLAIVGMVRVLNKSLHNKNS